ncbi:MAG: DNA recombination protein RmuC [Ilumatobacteraceae bacterium]
MDLMSVLVAVAIVLLVVVIAMLARRGGAAAPPPGSVDTTMLVTAVRAAVEAEVRRSAREEMSAGMQRTAELIDSKSQLLDEHTRTLLGPFAEKVDALAASVSTLTTTFAAEQRAVVDLGAQVVSLQSVTASLAGALKSPTARGSWGENQLRNIVQLAGMEPFCDYAEQVTGGDGDRVQRPDLIVKLPNGAQLAVDAKAPLSAYLRMQEAADEGTRTSELKAHARALRDHAKALADKRYWQQFSTAPEFVIMFVPGEGFVSDAMRADPQLQHDAMSQRVIIASPANLLAVLLAVAKGWQAHQVAEHAQQVARLGAEVYERVGTVLESVKRVGTGLTTATNAYNTMVGSMEGRLLVTLRRFADLGVVSGTLVEPAQIEVAVRVVSAAEAFSELPQATDD